MVYTEYVSLNNYLRLNKYAPQFYQIVVILYFDEFSKYDITRMRKAHLAQSACVSRVFISKLLYLQNLPYKLKTTGYNLQS